MARETLDANRLTGPQKAAVFLLLMGEKYTAQVFEKLDEDEISKLASNMSEIQYVGPDVMTKVMNEFIQGIQTNQVVMKGDAFLKTLMDLGMNEEKAAAVYREIERGKKDVPFNYLEAMDTKDITNIVKGEHPQTIALILVHLKPERAAEILGE